MEWKENRSPEATVSAKLKSMLQMRYQETRKIQNMPQTTLKVRKSNKPSFVSHENPEYA